MREQNCVSACVSSARSGGDDGCRSALRHRLRGWRSAAHMAVRRRSRLRWILEEAQIRRGTTSRVHNSARYHLSSASCLCLVDCLAWHCGKGEWPKVLALQCSCVVCPARLACWKARSACARVAGRWGGSRFRDCFSGYCRDLGGERSLQSRRKFGEHCIVFRSLRQLQTPL